MLARNLFTMSRSTLAGPLVRFGFRWFWWLIPVKRLSSTRRVLAFRHPRPSWPTHILVVPKTGIASLMAVDASAMQAFTDVLTTARGLAIRIQPEGGATTFLINGGRWQDVGQMHGHLAAGSDIPIFHAPDSDTVGEADHIRTRMHPQPERPFHALIDMPRGQVTVDGAGALIRAVQSLVTEHNLQDAGFALATDLSQDNHALRTFHLISGSTTTPSS